MKCFKYLFALAVTAALGACGGGGGNPGNATGASSTIDGVIRYAIQSTSLGVKLVDSCDVVDGVPTGKGMRSISPVAGQTCLVARLVVASDSSLGVPSKDVVFSEFGGPYAFFPDGAKAQTNAKGYALVKVDRATSTKFGQSTFNAQFSSIYTNCVVTATFSCAYTTQEYYGSSGSVDFRTDPPVLTVQLVNALDTVVTEISGTSDTYLKATLQYADTTTGGTTSSGIPVTSKLIDVTGDLTKVTFPEGSSGLTNTSGVAKIKVKPAGLNITKGASTLTASTTISGRDPFGSTNTTVISGVVDYQVPAGPGVPNVVMPTLSLGLSTSGTAITAGGLTNARAVVKDANGLAVAGKLVTISGDGSLIKLNPASGQVLTNESGVALVQVSPVSLSAAGASTLVATTTVGTSALTTSFDVQLSAANLGLQNLNLGSGPLAAYGNRPISVQATVDGVASISNPVQVTFTTTCGTVLPAVVTTDATGTANATYTASLLTCADSNPTITAAAAGATSRSGTISVAPSVATNVKFEIEGSGPQLIYLKDSVGSTQAQVVFRVIDSRGGFLQNKKLRLSLSNSATGVSLNTVGNTAPIDLTTDSVGLVKAAVFSGTVPTSLNVKATLLDNDGVETTVYSYSNKLTIASGRPSQRSLSLSVSTFSIEAAGVDAQETKLTLSMADRQGNPVPENTQVNFVSEAGVVVPAVCFVPPVTPESASSPAIPVSSCAVTLRSSGTRTPNGLVSVLAYVAGEEDFIDMNGNNYFDSGDTFVDLGRAYRDDNSKSTVAVVDPWGSRKRINGKYDDGEFQVPREGTGICTASSGCKGDGVWGAADVRQQATVVFASGNAVVTHGPIAAINPISNSTDLGLNGVKVTIADVNGNSMPTLTQVDISVVDNSQFSPAIKDPFDALATPTYGSCSLNSPASFLVSNSIDPLDIFVSLKNCVRGDQILIKTTSPLKVVTAVTFSVE